MDKPYPYLEDLNDLVQLAKKFAFEDPDGNGEDDTWGYEMFGSLSRTYAATQFRYLMAAAGQEYILPGKLNFNTERGVEVLKFMQDCVHTWKISPPDTANYTHVEFYRDVQAGKVGIGRFGDWNVGNWNKWLDHDYVIVPYPPSKKGETAYQIGDFRGLCISNNTEHPEETVEFCKFVLSKRGQEIMFRNTAWTVRNDLDLAALGAVKETTLVFDLASEVDFQYFEREPTWGAAQKEILARHIQACLLDPKADPATELAKAEEEILPIFNP